MEAKQSTILRRFCRECFKKPIGMNPDGKGFSFEDCPNPSHILTDRVFHGG